jgi:hypothetical protein
MNDADKKLLRWALLSLERRLISDELFGFDFEHDAGLDDDEWPDVGIAMDRMREVPVRQFGSWTFTTVEVVNYLQAKYCGAESP